MLVLVLLVLLIPVWGNAENKEYSIPSAAFDVEINTDGTADIKEHWTVRYDKGEFSRFYKTFYHNVGDDEAHIVKDLSVTLDGKLLSQYSGRSNISLDHYQVKTQKYGVSQVDIYALSRNMERVYEISYKLENAVKHYISDDDFYVFCYRFVGTRFEKPIDHIKVNIRYPSGITSEVLFSSGENAFSFSGDKVTAIETNSPCSGLYKVCLKMCGSSFVDSKLSVISHIRSDKKGITDYIAGFIVLCGYALIITGIIALVKGIKKKIQNKDVKKYIKHPGLLTEISDCQTVRQDPVFVARYIFVSTPMQLFFSAIAWMQRNNTVIIDDKQHVIYYTRKNDRDLAPYECEILDVLQKWSKTEDISGYMPRENYDIFPCTVIEKQISADDKRLLRDVIKALRTMRYRKMDVQKKASFLRNIHAYFMENTKIPSYCDLLNTSDQNLLSAKIFMYSYTRIYTSRKNNVNVKTMSDSYCDYLIYCATEYEKKHMRIDKNQYNTFTCTSGASCSSCGGGGAD